jgi:FlgN protein.
MQKKKVLVQDILDLTREQSKVINEDGLDELRKLIDKKQLKIDDMGKLDEEFNVYFSRLKLSQKVTSLDELDMAGVKGAKELKALTSEVVKIITSITEIEKENNDKTSSLLNQFGAGLKKVNQGKRVNNAYTPMQINKPSYFIDKKK